MSVRAPRALREASNVLEAMKHLGWKPQFTFEHGLAALAAAGTDPEAMRSSLARSIPAKGYHRTSS